MATTRRAIRGKTFKRSKHETRGRKKILSNKNLATLDKKRDQLITKADGDYEVIWDDVVKAARVPHVHRTTAAKNMNAAGYNIKWRTPRLKPWRSEADEAERKRMCNRLRKLPERYWQHDVHLYMDNTRWKIPMSAKGKKFLNAKKVRKHLRKPSEGLKRGYTKPSGERHKMNTGGSAHLCAAIIKGKVRVWHYLPDRWCGTTAEFL